MGLMKAATSRNTDRPSHEQAEAHALCSAQCADLMIERGQAGEAIEEFLQTIEIDTRIGFRKPSRWLKR